MKAFVVDHYGTDGLCAADVPEPDVGDGDVPVKVSAAGINPLDKMVRNGEFERLLDFGEGNYEETERAIQGLLGIDEDTVGVDADGLYEAADWDALGTGEDLRRLRPRGWPRGLAGAAGAQSLSAVRRLDGGGRVRPTQLRRRLDHVPVPRARPQPGPRAGSLRRPGPLHRAPRRPPARSRPRHRRR